MIPEELRRSKRDSVRDPPYDNHGYMSNAGYIVHEQRFSFAVNGFLPGERIMIEIRVDQLLEEHGDSWRLQLSNRQYLRFC